MNPHEKAALKYLKEHFSTDLKARAQLEIIEARVRLKTLPEVVDQVQKGLDDGIRCPACDKHAQRYKFHLNKTMCKGLKWMAEHHEAGREWVHLPSGPNFVVRTNQLQTTRHWGLIRAATKEDMKELPDTEKVIDGKVKRSGWWMLTPKGRHFVRGGLWVPSWIITYDGKLQEMAEGATVDFVTASKIDYDYRDRHVA